MFTMPSHICHYQDVHIIKMRIIIFLLQAVMISYIGRKGVGDKHHYYFHCGGGTLHGMV